MTHMSFHGALGNMTAAAADLAERLVKAVARLDNDLIIVSSTSHAIETAASRHGLRVATTFLADRACDATGLLVPRGMPDAVIHDEALVLERVRRLLREGIILAYDGQPLAMRPQSILVHGDTPGAVALARAIRREIEVAGGRVVPVSRLMV
jgi:UPF0271 protein